MEYQLPDELTITCIGNVRVVTLNRPDALNAISPVMQAAFIDVWHQIGADAEARAVVLTGAGRAFSAGGDLDNFLRQQSDVELRRRSLRNARRLVDELLGFHLPVVAAVNGPAVGLGATLAILSDYVVMSENSYLADTHVSVGLVAGDGGAAFWPLLCGLLRAKALLLLGERIEPAEAVDIGLANRVVPENAALEEAVGIARRFAELPPQAAQDTKRALNLHLKQAANAVLDFSLAAEGESFGTPDVAAAVARIRSRRHE
ncbi:MAG TPA: enoyl-CoA hydratase/isomerase family protein [Jatrophihabitantaceae bacterium]